MNFVDDFLTVESPSPSSPKWAPWTDYRRVFQTFRNEEKFYFEKNDTALFVFAKIFFWLDKDETEKQTSFFFIIIKTSTMDFVLTV